MKKALFILTLLLGCLSLGANILRVALDGSQPFTIIQEAINASANTDTVLVYPGRYYENISFYGKNITLASLEITTGNLDYKYNTILDGNQSGSVIQVTQGEASVNIRGFTITNGSGTYYPQYAESFGGGIFLISMSEPKIARIVNCNIFENQARSGGGIRANRCNLFLSGITLKDNTATSGGGLFFFGAANYQYSITFDPENRCSIYNNKAGRGTDIHVEDVGIIHVVVDTFTVQEPSCFYASSTTSGSSLENPYSFDIMNSVHEEVNHDLYVAPWGDDANNGLSIGAPLKTIFKAVYDIASDSANPKTIHIAEGYYSKTINQQFFPIPMKSFVTLEGQGRTQTIIDAESTDDLLYITPLTESIVISGISLTNGKYGIYTSHSKNLSFYSVEISNIHGIPYVHGFFGYYISNIMFTDCRINGITSPQMALGLQAQLSSGTLLMKNTEISNCISGEWMPTLQISSINEAEVVISGCSFHGNTSSAPDVWNSIMQIGPYSIYGQRLRVEIQNSSFFNNNQSNPGFMGYVHALNDTAFVSNCTFAGNSGGSSALMVKGNAVFENNIFWNPQLPKEVTAYYSSSEGISGRVEFDNNCIRNGLNGIYNMSPLNEIIWHDSNLATDPIFELQGNHPYRLSAVSPLIDLGLQSAFLEPATDAGGNERLWDGDGDGIAVIDIGAYEYQPITSPYNLNAELWNQQIWLSWQMPQSNRSLSGYRVYRNNNIYADILDPSIMQFRDYSPVNDTLTYYVVALFGYVESAPTNSVTVIVDGVSSNDETAVPVALECYVTPNPFSDIAVIRFHLSKAARVKLQIYNLKGQLVRTLLNDNQGKGEQLAVWEGCDEAGRHLASGIYFLRLTIDGKQEKPHRLVLVK